MKPYRPLGPYDYQEPPSGAALHIVWTAGNGDQALLDAFVANARAAGFPLYGAGLLEIAGRDGKRVEAVVVLARGTTEEQCFEFSDWVDSQPGMQMASLFRTGDEKYS